MYDYVCIVCTAKIHIDCFFVRSSCIASLAEWKWQVEHLWTCCKSASKSPCHTALVQQHCHLDSFSIGSKLRCSSCNVWPDLVAWAACTGYSFLISHGLGALSKWLALEPLHRHRLHVCDQAQITELWPWITMATISLCLCLFEMWAPELPQIKKSRMRHTTSHRAHIVISEVRTRDSKSKGRCKEQALGFWITRCCTRPS